jgi:hypothetical protein
VYPKVVAWAAVGTGNPLYWTAYADWFSVKDRK